MVNLPPCCINTLKRSGLLLKSDTGTGTWNRNVHNVCKLERFALQEIYIHHNNLQGGGGRNSKIVKNIICKASDFDFLNKTKNEHRCSTILRSKTCFVIDHLRIID